MKTTAPGFRGLQIIEPRVFKDARGAFMQTYHREQYAEVGIDVEFVQDNLVRSTGPVLRGMHYQYPHAQAKLVQAIQGAILDVVLDLRRGEPTFGQWFSVELNSDNDWQLFVPPGFAHGYCTLSDTALVAYKCSDFYRPDCERGLRWNDPCVVDAWPKRDFIVTDRDANLPGLAEFDLTDFGA